VLGATGRTGRQLVRGALEEGRDVTALVRDRTRLGLEDERLHVLSGVASDPATADQAVAGQDAVLCALGPGSPRELFHSALMRATIPTLVAAMQRHGVARLILLSALGAGESSAHAGLAQRLAFAGPLRQVGRDKARAEEIVRASSLDWTIVYPPSLTDAAAGGRYRHGESLRTRGLPRISRGDVAKFMLAQLEDPLYLRRAAILSP
jgi:putative NADH-flavin reductase